MRLIDADALERVIMTMPDEELCEDCCYNVVNAIGKVPTVGGWISVNDRLPEPETLVIILVRYEVGWYRVFAWLDKQGEWQSSAEEWALAEDDADYVTHWMPLPELPEGAEDESD